MSCSVALTTYNGIKYIGELLDSITKQYRLPDEIVVVDDCSNDETFPFLEAYAKVHPNISWKIQKNGMNLGWKCNFRKAISLCSNDIIFLADQDDIWNANKISEMYKVITSNEKIDVLVGNYEPKYEEDSFDKVRRKKKQRNDGLLEKLSFTKYFLRNIRPGCVYCFRKSFYEEIKKVDNPQFPHDEMLFSAAILRDTLYLYNRIVIKYRRHSNNTFSRGGLSLTNVVAEVADRIELSHWILDNFPCNLLTDSSKVILLRYKAFLELRLKNLSNKKIASVIFTNIVYHKYYVGFKDRITDIYVILADK